MNNTIRTILNENQSTSLYEEDNVVIGVCKCNYANNKITIVSWFVEKDYRHLGIGKELLHDCIKSIIEKHKIDEIEYIWNGMNGYVKTWLDHFDAVCNCPIQVLKNTCEDSWDNHIYRLNDEKLLKYLNLR